MLSPLANIPEANEVLERFLDEEFDEVLQLIPSSFEGEQEQVEECLSNEEAALKAIKDDVQAMEKAERKARAEQLLSNEGAALKAIEEDAQVRKYIHN